MIGGLLVGLGGPFWFDAVRSLSSLRSPVGVTARDDDHTVVDVITPATAAVALFKTTAAGRDARLGQGVFAGDDEPALG